MNTIELKAEQIADGMALTQTVKTFALDPFTVSVIVNILTELVKLYLNCQKTPAQTVASMQNPGLVERWRLRRVIRRHVDDTEVHHLMGDNIFHSTMKVASGVTEKEVAQMFEEVA